MIRLHRRHAVELVVGLFRALDVIPTMLRIKQDAGMTIDASGTLQGLGSTMVTVQRKEDQEEALYHPHPHYHVLPGGILLHNAITIQNVSIVPMVVRRFLVLIVRSGNSVARRFDPREGK